MPSLDPDSQARFFYLAILAMACLATIFGMYRSRLGSALQNAAIWGLIFVGLLVAYGFRDRIGLALVTGQPERIAEDSVRIHRAGDGHFYALVEVNGTTIDFLVDTGATEIVLGPRDAAAAGIDLDRLLYSEEAQTANGSVLGARVVLQEVRLGDFVDRDVPAVVNQVRLPYSLLGMRYLDRFSTLKIERDSLTLAR
ncbi:MAG TPA: TIGR02281 family clan AA aspartic protease [Paracoccaceae bacterium]|nr:TIGR02281 family clan AA aspartic protease [Paracoccaceae bacterium]